MGLNIKKRKAKIFYDWNVSLAIAELEGYAILIAEWRKEESSPNTSDNKKRALFKTRALISGYAVEVAFKTLFVLDNPGEGFEATHNLLDLHDGLGEETKESLDKADVRREHIEVYPQPFLDNRYFMEGKEGRPILIHQPRELTSIIHIIKERCKQV